ncbi:MAG: VWA domain-containing protein [Acidimicrobiia bacterium]
MRKVLMRRMVILFVAVALVVPTALASAQEDEEEDGPPAGAMLIILDASGSMNNVDEDGVPFIDKAKEAVLRLIDALPDDIAVGLRVYGHREPNTDAVRGCQDTELVAPVVPLDRDAIREAVEGLEASGFTPIGLSLQEAAADLPDEGPRTIILISDGEDTCSPPAPDPCQVAEDLFGAAFDVRIESVGFLIDTGSAAEQQLRCIAEVSGGGYRTVGRADELVAKLGEVATGILDWQPPMTLNGALEQIAAPEVPLELIADWLAKETPAVAQGRFVSLLMPGETRWFRFDLWENEKLWAFAELTWPPGVEATGQFEAIIIDPTGIRSGKPPHPGAEQRVTVEEPGQMIGVINDDPPQGYPPAGTYLLGFHWDAPAEVFLGSVFVSAAIVAVDPSLGERIEGALDPEDAPVLELEPFAENGPDWEGGWFRGPIAAGETRWYRLEMDRGEVMNVFALFPWNRVVGAGTEGEFGVELLDLEGNPVGGPFNEWPQMRQAFGDDRHQARVSGTTSLDPNPVPETVLIGFSWDGPDGQQSELRFEAETIFDAGRLAWYDQPPPEEGDEEDSTISTTTPTLASAAERGDPADADDGGTPFILFVVIGIAALTVGVLIPLAIRRRRSGS